MVVLTSQFVLHSPSRVDGQHAGNSGTQNGGQFAGNADGNAAKMDGNHSGAQLTRNVDGTHAGVDGIPIGSQLAGEIDETNAGVDGSLGGADTAVQQQVLLKDVDQAGTSSGARKQAKGRPAKGITIQLKDNPCTAQDFIDQGISSKLCKIEWGENNSKKWVEL